MAGKRWRGIRCFRFLCADPAERIRLKPFPVVLVRVGKLPLSSENNSTVNQHWRIRDLLLSAYISFFRSLQTRMGKKFILSGQWSDDYRGDGSCRNIPV